MKTTFRIHIIVRGTVQGVFFRHSTKKHADELGLVGIVKNTSDGSVEIIAEGSKEKIDSLITWAARGPELAHVTICETHWEDATGEFNTFSIL